MNGLVVLSHVVNWMDQTAAKQLSPNAIHRGSSEEGILVFDDPIDEPLATVLLCIRALLASQKLRLDDFLCRWQSHFAHRCVDDILKERCVGVAGLGQSSEECSVTPEVLASPMIEWMVMALGTLNLNPKKES